MWRARVRGACMLVGASSTHPPSILPCPAAPTDPCSTYHPQSTHAISYMMHVACWPMLRSCSHIRVHICLLLVLEKVYLKGVCLLFSLPAALLLLHNERTSIDSFFVNVFVCSVRSLPPTMLRWRALRLQPVLMLLLTQATGLYRAVFQSIKATLHFNCGLVREYV